MSEDMKGITFPLRISASYSDRIGEAAKKADKTKIDFILDAIEKAIRSVEENQN
jgi:predicted DNA-binding protein